MASTTSPNAKAAAPLPRNARLSAYYNRVNASSGAKPPSGQVSVTGSASSSAAAVPASGSSLSTGAAGSVSAGVASPTLRTDLPTGAGRKAVIDHATALTQTLPLADLMSRCSELRHQADRLSASLQTSSRAYYTHLAASSDAARTATDIAGRLDAGVESVAQSSRTAAAIAERLSVSRRTVDALHAVQRLSALRHAAQLLSTQLPALCADAVSGLCTQPAQARANLHNSAQRAAVVLPALETLGRHAPDFDKAAKTLRQVMESVRSSITTNYFPPELSRATSDDHSTDHAHDQSFSSSSYAASQQDNDPMYDEGHVLSLEDATRLRLLLGDHVSTLRHDFFRAVSHYAAAPTPTPTALAAAGPLRTGAARLHAMFCRAEVVPRMRDAARWYADLFCGCGNDVAGEGDDPEGLDGLMVCLSNIAEDAVAGRVRAALQQGNSDLSVEEVQGVPALLKAIGALAEGDGPSDSEDSDASKRVSAVLSASVEGLVAHVRNVVRDIAQYRLRVAFDAGAKGSSDIMKAVNAVRESISDIADWGDILAHSASDTEKLIEMAARSFTDPISSFKQSARVAAICDHLVPDYPALAACCTALRESSKEQARTAVAHALRQRLQTILNDKSTGFSANLLATAASILQDAERIARECDVPALRRARDTDGGLEEEEYAFLDDGWLARAALRDWLSEIRASQILIPSPVARTLQADAAVLHQVVGYDVVALVADALADVGVDGDFERLSLKAALEVVVSSNEYKISGLNSLLQSKF